MYPDIERGQRQMGERLRALPTDFQPPYDWLEFQRRTQVGRASREAQHVTALPYAAAAALLLLLALGSAALITHKRGIRAVAHVVQPAGSRQAAESARVDRTEATERWLASLPSEPIIVRFGTRVAVTNLEDRIAEVDDLLTAANFENAQQGRLVALQQE